jgi:hypothetical protein
MNFLLVGAFLDIVGTNRMKVDGLEYDKQHLQGDGSAL